MRLSLLYRPRIAARRFSVWSYHRRHPGLPLLAIPAIEFLADWIKTSDSVLEYGAGHSTRWYASRCQHITSVENIPEWAEIVHRETAACGNVDLRLFAGWDPARPGDGGFGAHTDRPYEGPQVNRAYVACLDSLPDNHFDIIINDGWCRHQVAKRAVAKLKPGGLFLWDDVGWSELTGSHTPEVRQFVTMASAWRRVSFNDGVHRTVICLRPHS